MSATKPQIHTSTAIPHSSRSPGTPRRSYRAPAVDRKGKPCGIRAARSCRFGGASHEVNRADSPMRTAVARFVVRSTTRIPGRQEPVLRSTLGGADRPGRPRLGHTAPMKRVARVPVRR
jgi:hypothetical protein